MSLINKSDLKIDKEGLDVEWEGQALLYFEYAEKLENSKQSLEEAEADFKQVKASLSSSIRESPEDFDLEKVTEKAIEELVILQAGYTDCVEEITTCKRQVNLLTQFLRALEHKKRALEKMVELFHSRYYAEPMVRTEEGQEGAVAITTKKIRKKKKKKG